MTPGAAVLALSQREETVLRLMANGLTNAAIARRLDVAQKTIRNYVSNVIGKRPDWAEPIAVGRQISGRNADRTRRPAPLGHLGAVRRRGRYTTVRPSKCGISAAAT